MIWILLRYFVVYAENGIDIGKHLLTSYRYIIELKLILNINYIGWRFPYRKYIEYKFRF